MDVLPTIRAARQRDFTDRRQELRQMPYADYLQTSEWRATRDRKIRAVGFRCGRCAARCELQVHHVTYERLGAERDSDLEVLCRSCHEGHHLEESRRQHLGVYIMLVSEAIRAGEGESFADLAGAVRDLCRVHHVPFDAARVARAIESLGSNRLMPRPRRSLIQVPSLQPTGGRPFDRAEATDVLRNLNIVAGFRSMPAAWTAADRYLDDMAQANAMRQQAALMVAP